MQNILKAALVSNCRAFPRKDDNLLKKRYMDDFLCSLGLKLTFSNKNDSIYFLQVRMNLTLDHYFTLDWFSILCFTGFCDSYEEI